jgi:hypothetical protein
LLIACGDDATPPGSDAGRRDSGTSGSDAGASDSGTRDAALPGDAATGTDADVRVDSGTDSGGVPLPGMCNESACTPECFRPYECVTVCGGPATSCGCCQCAEGSIDSITCPRPTP